MLIKSSAIDRFSRENPRLVDRRFGLPDVGKRHDGEDFNPTVKTIADAINYYGYEVRDENITVTKDTDLGGGNPVRYKPFPLSIKRMQEYLAKEDMYRYPYTEGSDEIRKTLLDYIESEGFINTTPYSYSDIDAKGLSVHNITFLPSTSIAFNMIISIISKPGDVVLVTGPNYGLFVIRAERAGAEVEVLNLEKEDHFLPNPEKLAKKIDDINISLQTVYNRRKGYVPRVVAFLNANPNNPTGKAMGEKEVKLLTEIANVCNERGVFIIDDLVYRDICFDKDNLAKPIGTIPGMFRNTISLFGLSKSYGLASLRAGFVVADELIIRELINRIFQGWDSSPHIVGEALAGAFSNTLERKKAYDEYFTDLRKIYIKKYHLLKALVLGIDTIKNKKEKEEIKNLIAENTAKEDLDLVLGGIKDVSFPENLEPDSGFFAILDFTKLKGKKYNGDLINTEKSLLQFIYRTTRIRFLVGKSISWPYEDELVGRVTFALEDNELISAMTNLNKAICKLEPGNEYIIRYNELKDQYQMASIKVDTWRSAYDQIVSSRYLNRLNVEEKAQKFIASFEEYKDLVLVAEKDGEILGYSCFSKNPHSFKYDSELISLYIKPEYKGKGIGTSLFKATAQHLKEEHKKNMIIWCFTNNERAIKFYEKMGCTNVETKIVKIGDDYYEEYGFYLDLESF